MLTVGQLKKALQDVDDDIPLAVCVYWHLWYANWHKLSHGELDFALAETHDGEKLLMLYTDWPRGEGIVNPKDKIATQIVDDFMSGNYSREKA